MYFLGLRQMLTKSGSDTLNSFQEILRDIEEVSEMRNSVGKKLFVNLVYDRQCKY